MLTDFKLSLQEGDIMNTTVRRFVGILVVVFFVSCSGCIQTAMIKDEQERLLKYPTYQGTAARWPTLKDGRGRIIIYFPEQASSGTDALLAGTQQKVVFIRVDKKMKTAVRDQTFVFVDLDEGKHKCAFTLWTLKKAQIVEVDVKAGETTYIGLHYKFREDPARIVEEKEALRALKLLRHNYKDPLPINDQPKGAARASRF